MYIPIAGIDSSKPDPKPERPETTPPVPMSYPDIQTGAWYHDAVSFVHSKSLMSGFDDGSFRPEASTTRGMVAAVLYRLDGADTPNLSDFQDVKPDAYYANAVAWGASNGIISGYSADIFGPDDPITREQFIAMLYRYAAYKGHDVSARADLSAYTDAGALSAYAAENMKWAVAAHLIAGMTDATLGGSLPATRAQVACVLARFCTQAAE